MSTTTTTTTATPRHRRRKRTRRTTTPSASPPLATRPFADASPANVAPFTTWMPQPSSERPPQMAQQPSYPIMPPINNGPQPYAPPPPQTMAPPTAAAFYSPQTGYQGYPPTSVEIHMLTRSMDEMRMNMQQMGADMSTVKVSMEGIRGSIMPRAEIMSALDQRVSKEVFVEFKTQTENDLNGLRNTPQKLIAYIAVSISMISVIAQVVYDIIHH